MGSNRGVPSCTTLRANPEAPHHESVAPGKLSPNGASPSGSKKQKIGRQRQAASQISSYLVVGAARPTRAGRLPSWASLPRLLRDPSRTKTGSVRHEQDGATSGKGPARVIDTEPGSSRNISDNARPTWGSTRSAQSGFRYELIGARHCCAWNK